MEWSCREPRKILSVNTLFRLNSTRIIRTTRFHTKSVIKTQLDEILCLIRSRQTQVKFTNIFDPSKTFLPTPRVVNEHIYSYQDRTNEGSEREGQASW